MAETPVNGQEQSELFEEVKPEAERFGPSDELIREVQDLIDTHYIDRLVEISTALSPADLADLLSKLSSNERQKLLEILEDNLNPEVFTHLDETLADEFLDQLSVKQIASLVSELDSDDALLLIERFDEDRQHAVLKSLSRKMRAAVEEGLTFPEESAGRLMQREVVAIPQYWTVGKTQDFLRAMGDALPDAFYNIFVVDTDHHVIGAVGLHQLLRSPRSKKVTDLANKDFESVLVTTDQEEVAFLFKRRDLVSAPVVDENNRLIGVITIDDVVDVIDKEAQEDILKLAGIEERDIHKATLLTVKSRFSWLAINLVTAIAASAVISLFEATISQVVALAVLMPIVASMGGNAGTQALTVAVRALATRDITDSNAMRVVVKEVIVGAMNGAAFAVIMGIIAALWFSSPVLGIVIGLAMVTNLVAAGFAGVVIPIVLHRIGFDPATSAVVFLTTVTDVVGFFAFLGLASLFLV